MEKGTSILIVDDDPVSRKLMSLVCEKEGYVTESSESGKEALEKSKDRFFNVSLLDIMLPDVKGTELIGPLKKMHPDMEVVIVTAFASTENAVRALNEGAWAYITKPINVNEMLATIQKAIEKQHLVMENRRLFQEAQKELAERKRAHKQMRLLSAAIESSPECISITDIAGNVIYANKVAETMAGIPREDIIEKKLLSFFPDPIRGEKGIQEVLEKGFFKGESEIKSPGGKHFWASSTCFLVTDEEDHPLGVVGMVEDITERKRDEQKKIQLKKMSALGTLTAGIAHELNNPMMGMLNFIEYCLKHTSNDDRRYPVLADAERETKRCIDIVQNLLRFSRIEKENEEKFKKESLSAICGHVFKLLSYRIEKENVLLTKDYSPDTPEIWMKESNIQQVILNLVGNALDALKESNLKELHVEIRPNGHLAHISVSDTGCGISPETLSNIFDPFFTTKPPGQGTGLGLSVCHSIVKAHGGEITCESDLGKGTTFHVLLPLERRRRAS